jgi:hypothetical protein
MKIAYKHIKYCNSLWCATARMENKTKDYICNGFFKKWLLQILQFAPTHIILSLLSLMSIVLIQEHSA